MHQFDDIVNNLKNNIDVRQSLIDLKSKLTERDEKAKKLDELVDLVRGCLKNEDAKARKNAATILGIVSPDNSTDELWNSYKEEDTLFVKEAYLLAIEKAASISDELLTEINKRLTELTSLTPEENEKKHINAEIKALDKLMSKFSSREKRVFTGWDNRWDVILEYPGWREFSEYGLKIMLSEVKKADRLAQVKKHPKGILVRTNDLKAVSRVKQYRDLTFAIKMPESLYTEETRADYSMFARDLAASNLISLVEKMYGLSPEDCIYFKLIMNSAKVGNDRTSVTRRISDELEKASNRRLISDTSKYDIEIIFNEGAKGCTLPGIKCMGLDDDRFSYRKNALSSSTHPSLVSLVLSMCAEYMSDDATILDAFCGVGTYIIERDRFAPSMDRYAVDIFGDAIRAAKENANLAHKHANFITRDIKDFTSKHRFDEIYADFPSANKREREAEVSAIYDSFFAKAESLLTDGGYIFAVSFEKDYIMKNLRLHPSLELVKKKLICEKAHEQGKDYVLYIIRK